MLTPDAHAILLLYEALVATGENEEALAVISSFVVAQQVGESFRHVPNLMPTLDKMAEANALCGKHALALDCRRKVHTFCAKRNSRESKSFLESANKLGLALIENKLYAEAKKLLRRSYQTSKDEFGLAHTLTLGLGLHLETAYIYDPNTTRREIRDAKVWAEEIYQGAKMHQSGEELEMSSYGMTRELVELKEAIIACADFLLVWDLMGWVEHCD